MGVEEPNLEALLRPLRRYWERMENGPACCLCRHSTLTEDDLPPDFLAEPDPIPDIAIRFERCPETRLNITAECGHQCRHFVRRKNRD